MFTAASLLTNTTGAESIPEPESKATQLLQRLRHDHEPYHDQLTVVLSDLLDGSLSVATYQKRLSQFYGFYRPLEAVLLRQSLLQSAHLQPDQRLQKTSWLAADLHGLGIHDLESIPRCTKLPDVSSAAAAFGCLYVLEGSTLGGQSIVTHSLADAPSLIQQNHRFFSSYGEERGVLWLRFRQALLAYASSRDLEDGVARGAHATYAAMISWFRLQGQNRDHTRSP